MSVYVSRRRLWWWSTALVMPSVILGFVGRQHLVPSERLHAQSVVLNRVARDAMLYRATPDRVAEKVEAELGTAVRFTRGDTRNPGVVVLPAETGFLGMGGRWILHLGVGTDGRCDTVWLEMQPIGYS